MTTKRSLIFAAKGLVTAGLVYWVLQGVEPDALLPQFDRAQPALLIAAAVLVFAQNGPAVTWRWERILSVIDRAVPRWSLFGPVIVSLFFNQVLPSTIGGDGMRVWLLRGRGRPLGLALRSVVIDRVVGFFSQLLLALPGVLYLAAATEQSDSLWPIALLSLAGIAAVALAPVLLRAARRLPSARLRRLLDVVLPELALLLRNKRGLGSALAASLAGQAMLGGAVVLLTLGFAIPVDPLGVFALVPIVILASAIPVSIAGWGLREGTLVFGFGLLGVGHSDAALVSIAFGLLFLAFGLLGGLVWLIRGAQRPQTDAPTTLSASGKSGPG